MNGGVTWLSTIAAFSRVTGLAFCIGSARYLVSFIFPRLAGGPLKAVLFFIKKV